MLQGNINQSLNELTKASVELAEAASNYGALKVIFGCFLVVFLLMFILFVFQSLNTAKRLVKLESASEKVLIYFSDLNNRTIGKEEAKSVLRETINRSEALVKYYVLKIRLENHISDREFTINKIRSLVDNDFSGQRAFLSRFLCCERPISFVVTVEDNQAISNLMVDWVYKSDGDFTVSLMSQAVSMYFDGMKIKDMGKIDEL